MKTIKAYNNTEFLNSRSAREIRVMCEMVECKERLQRCGIKSLVSFFGSARTRPDNKYYKDSYEIAYQMSKWCQSNMPDAAISSGGGPGIMEAVNKGAIDAGGPSIGMGISLPFEQHNNNYISKDLSFEFHYFFTRKYWCVYLAKAFIVMPGGVGTLDELFEVLTLRQTQKITLPVPIVLYDKPFWDDVINFDALVKHKTISPKDMKLFKICNSPEQVVNYVTKNLKKYFT
tara:strand:- start:2352 stop:3044 length:693 start_codon:yes stop_codon:yes gene_type:complete